MDSFGPPSLPREEPLVLDGFESFEYSQYFPPELSGSTGSTDFATRSEEENRSGPAEGAEPLPTTIFRTQSEESGPPRCGPRVVG